MKQQQLVQNRLKRLEQINDSVNKVRRKISGRNNLSEQGNIQKIERILFESSEYPRFDNSLIKSQELPDQNIQQVQSIFKKDKVQGQYTEIICDAQKSHTSLPDLSLKQNSQPQFGCIVSSKNGIYKRSLGKKQPQLESNVLTSSKKYFNDAFQTVRSINIGPSQQNLSYRNFTKDLKAENLGEQEILSQFAIIDTDKTQQIQRINFLRQSDNDKSNEDKENIQYSMNNYSKVNELKVNADERVEESKNTKEMKNLQNEKQQLEDEIAQLDIDFQSREIKIKQLSKFNHNKSSTKRKANWNEDRQNFEYQWQQLEDTKSDDVVSWQTLDQDLYDMLAEAESTQEKQNKQSSPQIDRQAIDSLSREVEELMTMNNLNFNEQEYQQQFNLERKNYNPPLDIIEEEPSMEISFLI